MTRSTPRPSDRDARRAGEARVSALSLLALATSLGGLHSLLAGFGWWFAAALCMTVVFAAGAIARYFLRPGWAGSLAAFVFGAAALTLFFAGDTAVLGIIPTPESFTRFADLIVAGNTSINEQGVPADATAGITFLICSIGAGIALSLDIVAAWWHSPALAGIPLLIILSVPNIVLSDLADPVFFVLTAVVYLLLLRPDRRKTQTSVAFGLGLVAIVGALVVAGALPPVVDSVDSDGTGLISAEINPIIDLGDDLRRGAPTRALSYSTDADGGLYLRLTILQDFNGNQWQPLSIVPIPGNTVDAIGAAAGLGAGVASVPLKTTVTIDNARGRWLPVPYPSTSIENLRGGWSWEPEGLTVRTSRSNMRGQEYTVDSLELQPTSTQLAAAARSTDSLLAQTPEGLDPVVAQTAAEVTGAAVTDYDKAMALQDWFRNGDFVYSEDAPVKEGFDGSGLDVLVPFLQAKSGYCVHFASAMAVMARTLEIPSRVVVGFLPGEEADAAAGLTVWDVSSRDLHAWPELFFAGVGWVRFEPTPGRGSEPDYRPAPIDNPSTPNVDESQPAAVPVPTTVATPTPTAAPDDAARNRGESDSALGAEAGWVALGVFVALALLMVPAVVRLGTRRRRISAVRRGRLPASAAWGEISDTARDLGYIGPLALTPRDLVAILERTGGLTGEARASLSRLRVAVEREVYAPAAGVAAAGLRASRGGGGAGVTVEDLARVLSDLRAGAELRHRLAAAFLPVTILDRARALRVRMSGE